MAWTTIFDCFTTSAIADLPCLIGGGFSGIFGGGLILVVMSMLIALIFIYKMRLPLDLSLLGMLGFATALGYAILPSYVFYVGLILLAVIAGWGFYKWTRR